MAGKANKPEVNPFDRFGSDDRATDAKSRGLRNITFPAKKEKPTATKKPTAKKKK